MVWFCLSMVYSILLVQAIAKSDVVFLTISKTLFTLMGVYFRLRVSFFNADCLGLAVNHPITFGESFAFLDRSLSIESNCAHISLSSVVLCSKLSTRTNNMVVPFLIQTRGMATKVAKEVFLKAFADVAANNPGLFVGFAVTGTSAAIGGTVWFGYDAKKKQWDRESNTEIAKRKIAADDVLGKYKIESDNLLSERQMLHQEQIGLQQALQEMRKTQYVLSKPLFPNKQLQIQAAKDSASCLDSMQENKIASASLDKDIVALRLKIGIPGKDLTASTTSNFVPVVLDVSKDYMGFF